MRKATRALWNVFVRELEMSDLTPKYCACRRQHDRRLPPELRRMLDDLVAAMASEPDDTEPQPDPQHDIPWVEVD